MGPVQFQRRRCEDEDQLTRCRGPWRASCMVQCPNHKCPCPSHFRVRQIHDAMVRFSYSARIRGLKIIKNIYI